MVFEGSMILQLKHACHTRLRTNTTSGHPVAVADLNTKAVDQRPEASTSDSAYKQEMKAKGNDTSHS